ncbi:lysophospholipid acyltransferase family protein [Bacillus massiliglaciei]|uniref:lysophospholipid acyltransferase family protein n=1 Tax=Bacillus massiliglaciei TaxID=1816693 RepID=UPI000A744B77|nr:lysophospholipid acyltransferase family protein [Bacillus massiliglaciei]
MNFYTFGKNVVKGVLSPFYRVKTKGRENFPSEGGILICANHIDNRDPLIVGITSPRDIHFMAKEELFKLPLLKGILPKVNAFPVKRGMSDREALRTGIKLLKEGKVLGLFPEGTRSKNGKLGKGLAGAGFFALRTDAKVIPCAIIGPYKLFGRLDVIYGEPIDFSLYSTEDKKLSAEEATEIIMKEIAGLMSANK